MPNKPVLTPDQLAGLSELLHEIAAEVDEDQVASLPEEEQVLEAIAREILKLERDLTLPGTGQSESARVDRLSQFIVDKDF
jgi:hypothetical protein